MSRRPVEPVTPEQITAMAPGLRRYAQARHVDPADVDDLVQETITRLLEVRARLDLPTSFAYALTILNNFDRSIQRRSDMADRHRHRLIDLDAPASADERVIHLEQADAVRRALEGLPVPMRTLLTDHYDADRAHPPASSAGATAARLARARARLRLEYLIALRHVSVPDRCRSVLLAISARDVRRQTELGAGRHLTTCPTCMALADPLASRDPRLFALWPVFGLVVVIRNLVRNHPVSTSAATALTLAGAATAVALAAHPAGSGTAKHPTAESPSATHGQGARSPGQGSATNTSPTAGSTEVTQAALCRLTRHPDTGTPSGRITVHDLTVTEVPADEAFIVLACDHHVVWVTLQGRGESPIHVRPHETVTLTGTLRPITASQLPPALSATTAARLLRSGITMQVPYDSIRPAHT